MQPTTRRHFFFSTGMALTAVQATRVMGANERVPLAVIGLGGRGRAHMNVYSQLPDADIVALCDVDQAALERGQALVEKATRRSPRATPTCAKCSPPRTSPPSPCRCPTTGTRSPPSRACQAGKDVYAADAITTGVRGSLNPLGTTLTFTADAPAPSVSAAGGSAVTFTCNANIIAVAGVCAYLNGTIASLYTSRFTNTTVNIYIMFGATGLGHSNTALNLVTYASFRSALIANASGANDSTAINGSVPSVEPAIFGGAGVAITNAAAAWRADEVGGGALEDDPAAVVAGARAEVDDPVGVRHDRLVVLDDDRPTCRSRRAGRAGRAAARRRRGAGRWSARRGRRRRPSRPCGWPA